MSNQLLFDLLLIIFVLILIYNEQKIVVWERKVWKYIKAFFKALYYTLKDVGGKTK